MLLATQNGLLLLNKAKYQTYVFLINQIVTSVSYSLEIITKLRKQYGKLSSYCVKAEQPQFTSVKKARHDPQD